ncbi:MAG TPA: RES domain-containing protein, partial [Bryobacteraceae bacterium]|nr:RES domain-containing protein [Bryobacteraceae bacterium]
MKAARICKRAFSELSGEGARIYGGRWNSPGAPAIYLSSTQAFLEVLVHAGRLVEVFETGFVCVTPGWRHWLAQSS